MAILAAFVFAVVTVTSVQGLTCNEGFNFTIGGVPLYYWEERECTNKSDCFMQELRTEIYSTGVDVAATYGGCISTSYSRIITCETLFGEKSTLNPTVLINMIPDFQEKIRHVRFEFLFNLTKHFKEFFSNGKGREEFIAGCFRFLENLGFNTDKAKPLEKPITELFDAVVSVEISDNVSYLRKINAAVDNALAALRRMNSTQHDRVIAENIYSFLNNWNNLTIRGTKYAPLVENLPELIKSALPTYLKPETWFDAVFDIMSYFKVHEPTQTSKDIVKTIKQYWDVPESEKKYINLVLDSIPGLVDLLVTGEGSVWLDVLRQSSTQNNRTRRLAASASKIIRTFVKEYSLLPDDVKSAIEWLPGISYYLFPEETTEINRVYDVLSQGFESLDFSNPTDTMEKTNMSNFILFITEKTGLFYPTVRGQKKSKQMNDLVIINAAKTVYNLIPEYTELLDKVFSSLIQVFETYPYFNASTLILKLGGEVPKEIKPILDNIHNVLSTVYDESGMNFKPDEFRVEVERVISVYKDVYTDSELPSVVDRWVNITYKSIYDRPRWDCIHPTDWWNNTYVEEYYNCSRGYWRRLSKFDQEIAKESLNLSTDLQFAIFKALDFPENPVFKALVDAFPDFELYLKAMRLLDRSDIKELFAEYFDGIYDAIDNMRPITPESLLQLINGTMSRIMVKLDEVVKDLRVLFSPDYCEYMSCDTSLCNTHSELKFQEPFTRDPSARKFGQLPTRPAMFQKDQSPTSGYSDLNATTTADSRRPSPTVLVNALAVWTLAKFVA